MTGASVTDRPRAPQPPQLPVDPRIAARWIAVRRDQNRRRWRMAAVALAMVTTGTGAWILVHSSVLAVHHVVIRGTGHTARGSVVAAAGLDHQPMLDVDAASTRERLLALPWVGQVRVHRHWPTTVTIDVVERSPFAQIAGTQGQPAVVDANGRVLAVGSDASHVLAMAKPPLPRLDGMPPAGPAGAMLAPVARSSLVVLRALQAPPMRLLDHASKAVAFTVTSVTRGADAAISATLSPGPITAIFGTTDGLDAKLVALRSVLTQLDSTALTGPTTIDVRVAVAPVLTDGNKSTSLSTTQRG